MNKYAYDKMNIPDFMFVISLCVVAVVAQSSALRLANRFAKQYPYVHQVYSIYTCLSHFHTILHLPESERSGTLSVTIVLGTPFLRI